MTLDVVRRPWWLGTQRGTGRIRAANFSCDLLVVTEIFLRLFSFIRALKAEIVGIVEDVRARVVKQGRVSSAIPLSERLRYVCYILK